MAVTVNLRAESVCLVRKTTHPDPQADFSKLSPHQKGTLATDAFPDRKYDGQIAEISPEADRQKATVEVKVQILNPDGYLRPDMNATVNFLPEEQPKDSGAKAPAGALVPAAAVADRDGKKVVFIVYNDKAVMREVKVQSQRSNGVLVEGLVGSETVITSGTSGLKDGDRIKIKGQS